MNQLYFIALIPPNPLKDKIQELKLEVKEKYNSSHSLNAPPHITLLSPFRLEDENENKLNALLKNFAQSFEPVSVTLNDFSTFPPRVIFIDVEKTPELVTLQQNLEELARSHSELFNYHYDHRPFHPHLTLAFKDLTKANFHRMWKEYRTRTFDHSFEATKLCLLKHTGDRWVMSQTYPLIY